MSAFTIRSDAPAQAVRAGRLGYDLNAEILLLHTIQTTAAVDELQATGVLRADPSLAATEWPVAYAWMNRMMHDRLPTTGDAALWLWARIRRDDLVTQCRRTRGQVLLSCRIRASSCCCPTSTSGTRR